MALKIVLLVAYENIHYHANYVTVFKIIIRWFEKWGIAAMIFY